MIFSVEIYKGHIQEKVRNGFYSIYIVSTMSKERISKIY